MAGGVDQQVKAGRARFGFDAAQEGREEGSADLRQQQAERIRATARKRARGCARHIMQFIDGSPDAPGSLGNNGSRAVQHPADGGDGHSGVERHVCNGGRAMDGGEVDREISHNMKALSESVFIL